jgi:flagellar L-ring protein precursor FlgH
MNTLILSLMLLQNPEPASQAPSLFSANAPDLFLYRDVKARNVGDILTIQVIENASATNSATTATQKKGDVSLSAPALAGLESGGTSPLNFSNVLQAAGGLNFNGTGSTTRSGQLQAAISARVVQVLPNGDLRIEGTKVVAINGERQTLTIGGLVRSHDVSPTNVILSTAIANMDVKFDGKGVVADSNKPGWFYRLYQIINPF